MTKPSAGPKAIIVAQVPATAKAAARKRARRDGVSLSEIVRRALAAVGLAGMLVGCVADNPEYVVASEPGVPTVDDAPAAAPTRAPMAVAGPARLPPGVADASGTFLLALATIIAPDKPIVFLATITITPRDASSATMDMDLQPLSATDDNNNGKPDRLPVGAGVSVDGIVVDAKGAFTADLGVIAIPGRGNPISGSDLKLSLRLAGSIYAIDRLCGTAEGRQSVPFTVDLKGSAWVAIRVDPTLATDALPMPDPATCS